MKYEFHKESWPTIGEGEKNCYLIANGLGGYNSMNLIGGVTRGDQALFMSAKKAPNVRWHMVTNFLETLSVDGKEYVLTSQRMAEQPDYEGFWYLESFVYDDYPAWTWNVDGVSVTRSIVMQHGSNTVAVQYEICSPKSREAVLKVKPLLRMTAKNTAFDAEEKNGYIVSGEASENSCGCEGKWKASTIRRGEDELILTTDGRLTFCEPTVFGPMYFSQDERDGREEKGSALILQEIEKKGNTDGTLTVICSVKSPIYQSFEAYKKEYLDYVKELADKAPLQSDLGKQLVVSADAYVVDRESTGGKSILAGFPFFEDWGRDTMIALPGITMVTGRFEECKSILRTFAKYEHKGLLPNLFPEGDCNPMYNSVDAPLLFINTVYEYVKLSGDEAFIGEVFPVLASIISSYMTGTDFHIGMDEDGLIKAGADLEQLTWMDVRVGDHLPTPRHGKPVEINAYWYSALKSMAEFAEKLGDKALSVEYEALAERVRASFLEKFWNEEEACLKDVLSGNSEENQVRCNQIWALTQNFNMLNAEQEKQVIEKVRKELYTTAGLRTLKQSDPAFHEIYIGGMQERDRAYHQGTVWAFPLGAYYRAVIRYMKEYEFVEKAEWQQHVDTGMKELDYWMREGCLGHLAEIYDGKTPTISRGCYAQAWSVGELLRAYYDWEQA